MGTLQLGCAVQYDAVVQSKEGILLGSFPISSVKWGRKLDDISEAVIEVPLSGADCTPCDLVRQLGVWHHELFIFRDGEYVWSGPIVQLNVTRTVATITARDLFALLDKRLIHDTLCFAQACGKAAIDLTDIGAAIIEDAFDLDGHNFTIEKFNQTGLLGERQNLPGEHALDAFTEWLNLGLDATVLGRKIILGAVPFGQTATLTSADFLNDLEFEVDGLSTATFVLVKGKGLFGKAVALGADSFGVHPYYGLLEFEGNDRSELDTQALVDQGATAVLASHFPAPVTLVTPSGARLNPNAPVSIAELVPGVLIPVIATDLCLEVSGSYVLTELSVDWNVDTAEENVSITLGTAQSTNSGEDSINN